MIDLYYKFDSKEDMIAALNPLGMTRIIEVQAENESISTVEVAEKGNHQYALCEVGKIPDGTANWHINIRLLDESLDLSLLAPFLIYPKHPVNVWA